jgi:hypothetical protein
MNRFRTCHISLSLIPLLFGSALAMASPSVDFVCPNAPDVKSVSFSDGWEMALVDLGSGTVELAAAPDSERDGVFSFSGAGMSFQGMMPEGGFMRDGQPTAQCHQTEDSLTAIALHGSDPTAGWPKHRAAAQGSANIRAKPDTASKRVASLAMGSNVTILQNAGVFREGFFWFEIEYAPGKTGFMWGALLCTNDEAPDLQATLRRC